MQEKSPWWTPVKIVKIGISANSKYRLHRVNAGIPNKKIIIVESQRVLFARAYERFLHNLFKDVRFTRRSKHPDIGRTEWFKVNFAMFAFLRFMLFLPKLITASFLWVVFVILA
jgi:hypothetical protein